MKYIESPMEWDGIGNSLFLAGGITGCPSWQQEMVQLLSDTPLVLLNPCRVQFPICDLTAARAQIAWEFEHLRKADAILFWFPAETVCPIALYELGAWSMTNKPLFVGVHPSYVRRQDVEIQTGLARPDIKITFTLATLAEMVMQWSIAP